MNCAMNFTARSFILVLALFTRTVFSNGSIEFIGPCNTQALLSQSIDLSYQSVGDLSIAVLEKTKTPFQGTREGFNSIFNTPIGLDALETISDTEMKSYGWCYSIDGVSPEIYAHQIPLTAHIKNIKWFFAYAHYKDGAWIRQCAPAAPEKPKFICKN